MSRLQVSLSQLAIMMIVAVLMCVPAALGFLAFGTTVGFSFMLFNALVFFLFSQIVRLYPGDHSADVICRSLLLAGLVCSVLALIVVFFPLQIGGMQFGRHGYFRLMGPFSTPNRFGEVSAIGVLVSLYMLFRPEDRRRAAYGYLALFFLFITIGSGSKGVLVGLAASLVIMLLFTDLLRKKLFLRMALLLTTIGGWLAYHFFEYVLLVTKLDAIQEGRLDLGSGREEIWARGMEVFLAASFPTQLLGHGSTAFVTKVGADAHSTFWNLLIDYGMVSILALIVLAIHIVGLLMLPGRRHPMTVLGVSFVVFCLARGVSMPTILDGFNFAMLAFWAGVAMIFVSSKRHSVAHA